MEFNMVKSGFYQSNDPEFEISYISQFFYTDKLLFI